MDSSDIFLLSGVTMVISDISKVSGRDPVRSGQPDIRCHNGIRRHPQGQCYQLDEQDAHARYKVK